MGLRLEFGFPQGNAGGAAVDELASPPEVSFRPHPHGGPEALWFYLRICPEGTGAPGRCRLVLRDFLNLLGASARGAGAFRPVARAAGGGWERLAAPEVLEAGDGRLHLAWTLPPAAGGTEVAACYPYGPAEVAALAAAAGPGWSAEPIGLSQEGRPIVRLASGPGEPGGARAGLYLIARQHSGETPGSWVLDGLLRRMAAEGAGGPLVWAVPLADVDGVERGDYGKDRFPWDLNRAWGEPPMRHEALVIQRDLRRWAGRCRPALAVDLHAPGCCEADGAYCFVPDAGVHADAARRTEPWVAAARRALGPEYASPDFARVAAYRSRWETPNFAAFCAGALGVAAFTVETSYQSAPGGRLLTVEGYREIGRRLAEGLLRRLAEPQG